MFWSVVAALALLAAGAVAAFLSGRSGADFMLDLEELTPALSQQPPVIEEAKPALSRRVVIAIVDGLRLDTSQDLPFLGRLRSAGVNAEAHSQYPTYSRPNYVNILTGVPPTASGVRTNRYPGTVTLDSLMDRVLAGGLHAGYASDYDAMPRLFLRPRRPEQEPAVADMDDEELTPELRQQALAADLRGAFDDARYAPWSGGFRDSAAQLIAGDDALVVLLIGVVDAAGHEYGGASEEYRAAAKSADEALAAVLGDFDLSQGTIIVVADHGHTDRGGHGGLEPECVKVPLILAGAGVEPGAAVDGALLQDVAPTAARLLGLPPPGHGLGRTLTEALAIPDDERAAIDGDDAMRAARNRGIVAGAYASARRERLGLRALRLAGLLLGGALVIGAAWALRMLGGVRLNWKTLVVGVPAFFGVYYILIEVLGQRFSPSMVPARGHIGTQLVEYGAVAALAQIAAGWWALRHKATLQERLAGANGIALVGLSIAMLPVLLLWALFPAPYVEVPGPTALVLIPAVKVSVACYAVGTAVTLLLEIVVFLARATRKSSGVATL
jgi:hypothetical protein